MNNSQLDELVSKQQAGKSLAQAFYRDEAIFKHEVETVISRQWQLVDHESRIPNPGDYFLFEVANDSIIIVRDKNNVIHAFYNVCRHRGTVLCEEKEGCRKLFVCPFHAWSYDLEGTLRQTRDMPEGFDKADYGLVPCQLEIVEGLIFLYLGKGQPVEFKQRHADFLPYLKLHGSANAKVAHSVQWTVECNWKLMFENFGECYHCEGVHPEFCKLYRKESLAAFGGGPASAEVSAELDEHFNSWEESAKALGHHTSAIDYDFESNDFAYAARAPFDFGAQTLSADGKSLAPLMGEFKEFDGAMSVIALNPMSCILGFNDYFILLRFTPLTATTTDVGIIWLVDENASEGTDYEHEKISEVGLAVMKADCKLTDRQQKGIAMSGYRPGVYSNQEQLLNAFVQWYLKQLKTI
jgi:phenylpropionate dioxygenase-like ring-hydroxylating dioxygenase large terminal subunit